MYLMCERARQWFDGVSIGEKKNIKHCIPQSSSHNAINLHGVERNNSEPLGNMTLKQVKAVHSNSNWNKETTAKDTNYMVKQDIKGPSQRPNPAETNLRTLL